MPRCGPNEPALSTVRLTASAFHCTAGFRMFRPALPFALAIIPALLLSGAPARAEIKNFRDFVAACDNARDCVAYGLGTDAVGAYLKIERGGAPDATPKIIIVADLPNASTFTLAFDDPALNAALPTGPHAGPANDENNARVTVDKPEAVAALLEALRKAKMLRVTRQDPPGAPKSDPVESELSMAGAVAALLWIDERQQRLGTTTALVRRGDKPASAVPAPPALPAVVAAKINTAPLTQEVPKALDPKHSAKMRKLCGADEDDAEFSEASRLDGKRVLYSYVCRSLSGAYNFTHVFLVAPEDAPQSARAPDFIVPPELKNEEKKPIMINPGFDTETATLSTFAKGRGPGDCGTEAGWTWDGKAFRVTLYRSMPYCRGVTLDDWPVLYRAARR
ncbi:MAG: hypothetical protein JWN71_2004 [Xanthobacteraceae bacterium]|nr:hypothetical protein [Xanthobacteraceae bacterium]